MENNNAEKKSSKAGKTKTDPWMIATIALGVLVIILLFSGFSLTGNVISGSVSEDIVAENVVGFLNSQTGGGVEAVSVDEKYGLYEVIVEFQGQQVPVYATKNGEVLIQGVIPLDDSDADSGDDSGSDSDSDAGQAQTSNSESSAEVQELINTYAKGSGTPTLVINCKYKRTGSMAVGEMQGAYPAGTEKQDLINTFCDITKDAAFCAQKKSVEQSIDATDNGLEACAGEAGELIKIYSFHSPTCGYCSYQQPILDELVEEFPGKIELISICNPIHGAGDVDLCLQEIADGTKDWVV